MLIVFNILNHDQEEIEVSHITVTQLNAAFHGILQVLLNNMVRTDPTKFPIILAKLNFSIYYEYLLSLKQKKQNQNQNQKHKRAADSGYTCCS